MRRWVSWLRPTRRDRSGDARWGWCLASGTGESLPRPIPVISVSGYSEELVPRLAQAPFARKLLKPVAVWELGGMIRDVLDGGGHGDGSASA